MNHISRIFRVPTVLSVILLFTLFAGGCSRGGDSAAEAPQEEEGLESIAVFVPGVVAGSPTYEMMVEGVEKAASEEEGLETAVVEGGFNQGEWLSKLTSLAASGKYDLIVTSNPAMPEICEEVSLSYPEARFLILDGHLEGNSSIYTFRFNQNEQAYLAGYFAGLVSRQKQAEGSVKVGLVAGQEYPDMNRSIRPGYLEGAVAAAGEAEVDFRVVGNWYDAGKGSELARDIYRSGSSVILAIAGGANQGVVSAANDTGNGVIWFDSSGYDVAPGTVLGSTRIELDRAAYEKTREAIAGKLPFGSAETVGIADGYIGFVTEHPAYREYLDADLRKNLETHLAALKSGEISVPR